MRLMSSWNVGGHAFLSVLILMGSKVTWWGVYACSFCSRPACGELFSRDVQAGSPVRVPLHWTGLLERAHHRRRARHHSWLHHNNWNLLQGNTRTADDNDIDEWLGGRGWGSTGCNVFVCRHRLGMGVGLGKQILQTDDVIHMLYT